MSFAPQRRAIFRHLNFKNGSEAEVFCVFWLANVFAPQRHAIFRHLNLKNCSGNVVFCAFWLENVLHATAAYFFLTSELAKLVRSCGVLCILAYKCASRHSGVPFFISRLNSYLRTRRFREPIIFEHQQPRIIEKHSGFPSIWHMCIFFLVTLLACWSRVCWLDCSTLLVSCPFCRKLDF